MFFKRCAQKSSTKKSLLQNKKVVQTFIIMLNKVGSNTITEVVHFDTFVSLNDCINYVQSSVLNKLFFCVLVTSFVNTNQSRLRFFTYHYQFVTYIYMQNKSHLQRFDRPSNRRRPTIYSLFFCYSRHFYLFFLFCFVNTRATLIHHTPIYVIWLEEKCFYFVSLFSLEAKDKKEN